MGTPSSVPQARRWVVETLCGLEAGDCEAAAVLVSELATNALLYGGGAFEVSVDRRDGGTVVVEVRDGGSGWPTLRRPGDSAEHGRGLQLVEALSTSWGVRDLPGHAKSVWFEMAGAPEFVPASSW